MDIDDLNLVFYHFYQNNTWYHYYDDIKQGVTEKNQYSDVQIQALLQKLVKDGYVIEESQTQDTHSGKTGLLKRTDLLYGYYISYEGIKLMDSLKGKYANRPYHYLEATANKKKKDERIENMPKRYWYILAIIGYLVGIFAPVIKDKLTSNSQAKSIILTNPTTSNKKDTLTIIH